MEIVNDHLVQVSRVHRVCVLELFTEWYQIDLVPIPFHESNVIVGVNWFIPNGEMVDCEYHLVRV